MKANHPFLEKQQKQDSVPPFWVLTPPVLWPLAFFLCLAGAFYFPFIEKDWRNVLLVAVVFTPAIGLGICFLWDSLISATNDAESALPLSKRIWLNLPRVAMVLSILPIAWYVSQWVTQQ